MSLLLCLSLCLSLFHITPWSSCQLLQLLCRLCPISFPPNHIGNLSHYVYTMTILINLIFCKNSLFTVSVIFFFFCWSLYLPVPSHVSIYLKYLYLSLGHHMCHVSCSHGVTMVYINGTLCPYFSLTHLYSFILVSCLL